MISVVIPALNEAARLGGLLEELRGLEVIVADGGSVDDTIAIAERAGARVVKAPRGRGPQLEAGARAAAGDVLWFVHADTRLPATAAAAVAAALREPGVEGGTFRLRFEGAHGPARCMTRLYAWLQEAGLSYGDASIFVRRQVYAELGGFRAMPLFEDLEFVRRLRRRGGFRRLDAELVTSSRRFPTWVAFARAWAWWITLHLLYWAGASPAWLARLYGQAR